MESRECYENWSLGCIGSLSMFKKATSGMAVSDLDLSRYSFNTLQVFLVMLKKSNPVSRHGIIFLCEEKLAKK